MLASFLEVIREGDMIAPRRLAERLRLPMTGLAKLAHVNRNTLATNAGSAPVQAQLGKIAGVIARATELSGDEGRAIIWFRHQPIASFGGRTAKQLVEEGHADAVMEHLAGLENGVYA